ncbi:MAG: hypothetical protein P9L94_20140 [Candidatus Hinthialibacter antarcticus]|nr:hypothetical protein [Candidatus Hinthialibacter antarcticus]
MQEQIRKGPWSHRLLLFFFSSLLSLLFIWLLGFVLKDIGTINKPDVEKLRATHIDQEVQDQHALLTDERNQILREIKNEQEHQELLRNSTQSSRETMNQLAEIYRLKLERNLTPGETEQVAMEESQALFLKNQREFEAANQRIAQLNQTRRELDPQIDALQETLGESEKAYSDAYSTEFKQHRFTIACLRLAFLIPLLVLFAWLTFKMRSSPYILIINAALFALFVRTYVVMFEHFPRDFFKYIAILSIIIIVLSFIVYRVRLALKPLPAWLMNQYREAYMRRLCPVCSFPIQQGPLKFARWSKKGLAALPNMAEVPSDSDKPYTCPSCGNKLFDKCESCGSLRHTLLPHCESCGAKSTSLAEVQSE